MIIHESQKRVEQTAEDFFSLSEALDAQETIFGTSYKLNVQESFSLDEKSFF